MLWPSSTMAAPPKPAKTAPETPIEAVEVETVEEVATGVALVTDYQFVGVPEPAADVQTGAARKSEEFLSRTAHRAAPIGHASRARLDGYGSYNHLISQAFS